GKKVTARIGEMLHLPGAVNTEGAALANSSGAASVPPGMYQPQPVQQPRRGFSLRNILIVVLLILVVLGGLSYALLSTRNNHGSTTVTQNIGTQTGLGIGVT